MDIRAQFEEWFKIHGLDKVSPMSMLERRRLHSIAWSSWQASRASIEVELPDYIDATTHGFSAFNDALDLCDNEIRKQGISIKEEIPLQHEAKEG